MLQFGKICRVLEIAASSGMQFGKLVTVWLLAWFYLRTVGCVAMQVVLLLCETVTVWLCSLALQFGY